MDEVHRAAEIAMDYRGFRLNEYSILGAVKLLKRVEGGHKVRNVVKGCASQFFERLRQQLRDNDRILKNALEDDSGLINALQRAVGVMQIAGAVLSNTDNIALQVRRIKLKRARERCRKLIRQLRTLCRNVPGDELDLFDEEDEDSPSMSSDYVYYLEEEKGRVTICAKDMDVQPFFRSNIFSKATTIMTSATLSVGNSFRFIAEKLGLEEHEYRSMIAPSPFDYSKMLVVVPNDFVSAKADDGSFPRAVGTSLAKLAEEINEGGILALFTSLKNMRAAAARARELTKIHTYVQEEMPKQRIIDAFKKDYANGHKSVIFATQSFWEGVDIPGQALSIVAIDKIPFATPDNPVLYHLERNGENAFHVYSLPAAAIALKQGVGRLLRRETDYGAIVIFDTRIQKKFRKNIYQAVFPEECQTHDELDAIPYFLKTMGQR
jgi:ATP-dependent DNA helicase DinG